MSFRFRHEPNLRLSHLGLAQLSKRDTVPVPTETLPNQHQVKIDLSRCSTLEEVMRTLNPIIEANRGKVVTAMAGIDGANLAMKVVAKVDKNLVEKVRDQVGADWTFVLVMDH